MIRRALLFRAWVFLGLIEAALVLGGFFFVLLRAGWSPGDPVGGRRPAPRRLPAGDDDDVRRDRRLPDRHGVRRPHRARLAAVGRPLHATGCCSGASPRRSCSPPRSSTCRRCSTCSARPPLGAAELAILLTFPLDRLGRRRAAALHAPQGYTTSRRAPRRASSPNAVVSETSHAAPRRERRASGLAS